MACAGWNGSCTDLNDTPASIDVRITPPGVSVKGRLAVRITCNGNIKLYHSGDNYNEINKVPNNNSTTAGNYSHQPHFIGSFKKKCGLRCVLTLCVCCQ